jgi:hypothetical protein
MARRSLTSGSASNACATIPARRFPAATALALGSVLLAVSTCSIAQIPQDSGTSQQQNRASSPESSASDVHESYKPQSKDAADNARGKTEGKGHKTDGAGGAGGFNNGLYGTGAGSNK